MNPLHYSPPEHPAAPASSIRPPTFLPPSVPSFLLLALLQFSSSNTFSAFTFPQSSVPASPHSLTPFRPRPRRPALPRPAKHHHPGAVAPAPSAIVPRPCPAPCVAPLPPLGRWMGPGRGREPLTGASLSLWMSCERWRCRTHCTDGRASYTTANR